MNNNATNGAIPGFVVGTLVGAPTSLIGVMATAAIGGVVSANIKDENA